MCCAPTNSLSLSLSHRSAFRHTFLHVPTRNPPPTLATTMTATSTTTVLSSPELFRVPNRRTPLLAAHLLDLAAPNRGPLIPLTANRCPEDEKKRKKVTIAHMQIHMHTTPFLYSHDNEQSEIDEGEDGGRVGRGRPCFCMQQPTPSPTPAPRTPSTSPQTRLLNIMIKKPRASFHGRTPSTSPPSPSRHPSRMPSSPPTPDDAGRHVSLFTLILAPRPWSKEHRLSCARFLFLLFLSRTRRALHTTSVEEIRLDVRATILSFSPFLEPSYAAAESANRHEEIKKMSGRHPNQQVTIIIYPDTPIRNKKTEKQEKIKQKNPEAKHALSETHTKHTPAPRTKTESKQTEPSSRMRKIFRLHHHHYHNHHNHHHRPRQ